MIVKTRLGALVAGTVARDPEVKTLGNSDVLILNVKAQSEKDATSNTNKNIPDFLHITYLL